MDWPALVTALAGLVTAVGWAASQIGNRRAIDRTGRAVDRTETAVGVAATAAANSHNVAEQTLAAIGPKNGKTLAELVRHVGELDTYTHDSIHKIAGKVDVLTASLPEVLGRLDGLAKQIAAAAPPATATPEPV